MLIINELLKLEKKRNEIVKTIPLFSKLPIPVPINIGKINGGKWPSSVSDNVILEGRLGVTPYETVEDAKKEFEDTLNNINDEWLKNHPVKIEWVGAAWVVVIFKIRFLVNNFSL
jgi:acetylornithine deacetylase